MIALIALLLIAASAQESSPPFSFEIIPNGLDVAFIIQNRLRTALTLVRWNTPLERNVPFRADMFSFRGESEPIYAGVDLKRVLQAEDLLVLEGGESARGTVNLENGYWFQRGRYEARFVSSILVLPGVAESLRNLSSEEDPLRDFTEYPLVSDQTFVFETEGKINPPGWWDPPILVDSGLNLTVVLPPKTYNCSTTQTKAINTATNSAKTYAYAAQAYLNLGYTAPAKRYTTWFGIYDNARWDIVKTHFDKIKERTKYSTYEVDCYCDPQYISAYAYVYSAVCCRVHVCNAFWAAANTGTDSRAGTIIHELSHFDIVANTNDHAYGHQKCKQLAVNTPSKAIQNADSHEYFAENTPVLT